MRVIQGYITLVIVVPLFNNFIKFYLIASTTHLFYVANYTVYLVDDNNTTNQMFHDHFVVDVHLIVITTHFLCCFLDTINVVYK